MKSSSSNAQQILFSQFYQTKFEDALSKKEYATALKLIQHAQSKKHQNYHHEQVAIFTNLKLFADCASFCDHALKNSVKDDPLFQIQCRISTALSYQHLYQIEKAKKIIGLAEADLDYHKDKLSQGIVKSINDKIVNAKQLIESTEFVPIEKRKEEARAYKQLIDNEKTNQDLNEEGKTVFLIPITWLTKWKEYSGYSQLFESSDAMEEETAAGNGGSKRFEDIFPGAIDTRTLLEASPISQLLDTQESEFHSNYILKQGQVENKDFLIATQPIADFFYDIYGGIRLKRQTLENPVTKEINVDLFFKKVTFMPFPQLSAGQSKELIYSVYVSKFATIKELVQKIKRASLSLPNINVSTWNHQYFRFYRLSEQQVKEYEHVHKNLLDRVRDAQIQLDVETVKVLETSFVDDMQIDSKDIFILELSDSSTFKLVSSKNTKSSSDEEDSKGQSNQSDSILASNVIVEEDSNTSNSVYPTGRIKHRPLTETQLSHIKKYVTIPPAPRGFGGKKGVTGLQNLGNTCFMNSSLQCLSNVEELTTFLINNNYLADLNPKNVLGAEGKLATAYAGLMRAMWSGGESYVSAHEFKKVIGKFAPQFYGYGQQDSQELLSYLLDGLHEDLNRVIKKPEVESIDYFGDSKWTEEEQKQHDSEMAPKFFMNYKKRNDSVICDLMVGQYKSTLICPQCKRISIIFDPFLMLSVPVSKTAVNVDELNLYFIFKDLRRTPIRLTPTLRHNLTISEFKEVLSAQLNVPAKNILLATINKLRLESIMEDTETIQAVADKSGVAFFFEIDKPFKLLPVNDGNQTATMQIEEEKKPQTTTTTTTTAEEDNKTNSETQKTTEIEEELHQQPASSEADQIHQESSEPNYLVQVQVFMTSPKNITACQSNNISSSIVKELQSAQLKSYARFLSLSPSTTVSDLYVQMYRMLRPHLDIYVQNSQQPAIKIGIDIKDDSEPTLVKESTEFSTQDNQLFTFLTADYSQIQMGNTNPAISLHRSETEQFITVNIFLSDLFDFKMLKLQRCDPKTFDFPKSTYQISKKNGIHLSDCLDGFVKCEKLGQGNEWYCSGCSKHVLATKQMQIYKTPKILIVHIKRFKAGNVRNFGRYFYESGGQKINDEIDFPIENLDMTKYVLGAEGIPQVYDLFAVSEHYGSLGGGHYTACAKNFLDQRWYNFNDSHVSPTSASQAVCSAAYVLFYRRRD